MIFVKDVMTRRVKTIPVGSSVQQAAKAMARWKIGALVVTDGKKPVGLITEGDVSRCVAKGTDLRSSLKEVGRRRLLVVDPGEKLEVAAKMMSDAGVKKLPVLEDGRLVGIVTQTDIVASSFSLVTSLKEMVQARYRPPDFQM